MTRAECVTWLRYHAAAKRGQTPAYGDARSLDHVLAASARMLAAYDAWAANNASCPELYSEITADYDELREAMAACEREPTGQLGLFRGTLLSLALLAGCADQYVASLPARVVCDSRGTAKFLAACTGAAELWNAKLPADRQFRVEVTEPGERDVGAIVVVQWDELTTPIGGAADTEFLSDRVRIRVADDAWGLPFDDSAEYASLAVAHEFLHALGHHAHDPEEGRLMFHRCGEQGPPDARDVAWALAHAGEMQ